MPQMSPLKWLLLLTFLSAIYLIFASIMYFNMVSVQLNMEETHINKMPLTWTW